MHIASGIGLTALLVAAAAAAPGAAAERSLAISATSPQLRWGPCPPPFARGCEIAVLHGDPSKPNADVLLRVPGGFVLPPHRHTSAERLMLATGQLRVRYEGEGARTLTPGTYAFGPAGKAHEARCLGRQRCTLFIAFEGPVDAIPVKAPIR
jgi:quercetin dioxygenase-like cupin family protein